MEGENDGLPALEVPCDACGGSGEAPRAAYGEMRASFNCSTCKGHGTKPTAAGRLLLEFVKARLNLSEPEVRRGLFGA